MLWLQTGAQEAGSKYGQERWSKLAKNIFHGKETFHPIEHHPWTINCGKLAGSCQLLLRDGLGISQLRMKNCIVHHLFLWGFIAHCLLSITIIIFYTSIIKLFLSQPKRFFWFSVFFFFKSSAHPWELAWGRRMGLEMMVEQTGCMVIVVSWG